MAERVSKSSLEEKTEERAGSSGSGVVASCADLPQTRPLYQSRERVVRYGVTPVWRWCREEVATGCDVDGAIERLYRKYYFYNRMCQRVVRRRLLGLDGAAGDGVGAAGAMGEGAPPPPCVECGGTAATGELLLIPRTGELHRIPRASELRLKPSTTEQHLKLNTIKQDVKPSTIEQLLRPSTIEQLLNPSTIEKDLNASSGEENTHALIDALYKFINPAQYLTTDCVAPCSSDCSCTSV